MESSKHEQSTHLRWYFCDQEPDTVHVLRIVVVIGRDAQVIEQIVRNSITQIATINVQTEEHDQDPEENLPIDSAAESILLFHCPTFIGVKAMSVLIIRLGLIVMCKNGVVKHASNSSNAVEIRFLAEEPQGHKR
jgi:hypothetical protein